MSPDEERKHANFKDEIVAAFDNHKPSKPDITREEREELTRIRHDPNTVIKPSDKSKKLVAMRQKVYLEKAGNLLSDSTMYKNIDLTINAYEEKVKSILKIHCQNMDGDLGVGMMAVEYYGVAGSSVMEIVRHAAYKSAKSHNCRFLRTYLQLEEFYSEGQVDANTLVVLVSGEQLVGKSTLIKTLREEGNNGTSNDSKRTRGIQMSNFTDNLGQHLRIKDLAGQDAFSATHDIFCLSTSVPSLGLAVVNSKWDEKRITTSITTTVGRFLSRKPPSVTSDQPFTVMIIATFRDEIKREDHGELAAKLAASYSSAKGEFGDKLHFQGPFAINATVNDASFDRLREKLSVVCRDILSKSCKQPKVLGQAEEVLAQLHDNIREPFSTSRQFSRQLCAASHVQFDDNADSINTAQIRRYRKILNAYGLIVSFSSPELDDIIVNRPNWLLSKVIGLIFAPPGLDDEVMLHFKDGVAKVQEVLDKLNSCEGAEGQGPLLLQMVIQLGVLLQEKERILAPSRLPTADNCLGPLAKKDSSPRSACAGVSFTTQHCFSTALVIRLQTELYAYFHELHGIPAELWKNLVVVTPVHSTARGCISVTDSLRQAVAVVHAPVEDTLDGYCLLALLRKVFDRLAAQYSPGTNYSTSILSSASIRQHLRKPSHKFDFAVYNAEQVRASVATQDILSTTYSYDDRAPLLLEWPVNHASLLSAKSSESIRESLGESDLPALATCLGLTSSSSSRGHSNHLHAAAALVHSWAVTDYHHTSTKLHQLLVKSPNAQRFAKICKVLRQHEELLATDFPDIFRKRRVQAVQQVSAGAIFSTVQSDSAESVPSGSQSHSDQASQSTAARQDDAGHAEHHAADGSCGIFLSTSPLHAMWSTDERIANLYEEDEAELSEETDSVENVPSNSQSHSDQASQSTAARQDAAGHADHLAGDGSCGIVLSTSPLHAMRSTDERIANLHEEDVAELSAQTETFLKNPFKHAIFINDIHIWLQSLDAASLRGKAQKYGFFTDLARIDRLALTERNHGNEPHNRELLAIIMAQERDGYINLCKMVKEFGLYTTRLEQMNSLLTESDQV
ncbi:uncharacterized protein LOC135827044 [Sycon ciliatum]|uniref:uncharacterized protein LOC135827044 n=1 Tax=Sycon ciliatum TaxID=27933 RepID=UPI0031F6904B